MPAAPASQTLSRGIQVLEFLAEAHRPQTIAQVAEALGVHRSIAYRIIRTLEDHRLVVRNEAGALALGPMLAALAQSVSTNLPGQVQVELTKIADESGLTSFLAVLDESEVITIASAEPSRSHAAVAQRPGSRHSIKVGAPGLAIQTLLSPAQWEKLGPFDPETVEITREAGYAHSRNEVIEGLSSLAVPISLPTHPQAALSVVYIAKDESDEVLAKRLKQAAGRLSVSAY